MTAPRPREQSDPPSPSDAFPPRRAGRSSPYIYAISAAGRAAGRARPRVARRGLVRSARALAAVSLLTLSGALALPAAAQDDGRMSVPEETEPVCRPLPSGPPAPTCDGGTERGVILVGGSAPSEGSVRICHDNEFRSVCDDFFTHRGAGVVCRQLGYPTGVPTQRSRFVGDAGPVSYWLDDVDCRGTEANLGDCPHPGWGLHNCGADERVGVICMTRVTGIVAVGGERQVSLSWDTPLSRYDRGITGHEYRYKTRGEDGYGPWRPIPDSAPPKGETGKNFDSYTVTGLTKPGTVYSFQVRIVGGGNASEPATATVRTAGEANRLPEFGGPATRSVAENSAAGSAVGAPVTATDADGDTLRYSLEAVDDHASFTIDSSSGQIETRAAHDHEARSRYAVTVKAADGAAGSDTVAVTIEIADVEEQPRDAEIVTDPGSDGVWSAGEQVEARVQFGVPVRVTLPAGGRAPELMLAFYGSGGRVSSFGRAAYTSGSGTDTLSFAYRVTPADTGAARVVAPRNALRSGDASIEPVSGASSAGRALRGRFVSPPARHDGKKRIKVRVEFSENIGISYRSLREDAFTVTGGRVTRGKRVDDRRDLFEMTVEPDGGGDVAIVLEADRDCAESGAICTTGEPRRKLTNSPSATVAGPDGAANAPATGAPAIEGTARVGGPLTASTADVADEDGLDNAEFAYQWMRGDADIPGVDGRTYTAADADLGERLKVRVEFTDDAGNAERLTGEPTDAVAAAPVEVEPLTAWFEDLPAEHNGRMAFTLRIAFSEPIRMSGRRLRAEVVAVAGGRVTKARPVNGRKDRWDLTVKPDSRADVTITLAAGAACDTPAAVCTKRQPRRPLTTTLATTVPGPVALTVADARAEEGIDKTLDFAVSLSRAASRPVRVAYATVDGTARAGADYTRTRGTLRFAPGETVKTVRVPVLDDAHDEGEETLTFRLSTPSGAVLADGVATGTIENTDHLQRAWLARFGRTAATHVTDAVSDRLRGTPGQGSHLTVGGYRLPLGQRGATDGADDGVSGVERLVLALGQRLGLGTGTAPAGAGGVAGAGGWPDAPVATDPRLGQSRTLDVGNALNLRQVLLGSSFRLAFGRDDVGSGWPRLTAWGRVAGTTFDGRDGDLSLNGDVLTGTVGVDGEWDRLLAGLAVAHSRGNGSFTLPGTEVRGPSGVENTLTSVHPYLRYAVNDRLDVWGVLGYGTGQVELERDTGETLATDMDLVMGAFGGRGILLAAPEGGGFELATRTDAMLTRTSSDTVAGLAAGDAEAHRLRLILEGSRGFAWAEGRSLTPTMQLGLRHDWGDAETGFGLELGGRVQYADPALGLTIEGAVRGLLAHEDDDYKEWGAWGTVRVDPGATGQGLSLTLSPAWGAASSGLDGLWSRQTTAGLAPQDRQRRQGQVNLQVGYGIWLPALGGTLTPGAGLQLTNNGQSQSRASLVFDGLRTQAGALRLALEGGRTANPSGPPAYNIGLQLQLTFGNAGQATPAPTGPAASAPAMRHSTPTGPAASAPAMRHSTPAGPAASAPAMRHSTPTGPAASTPAVRHSTPAAPAASAPARSESHTARPAEQRAEAGDRHYFVQLGAFRHPDDADRARHDLAGDLAGLLQRPDTPRLAVLGSPQGGPTRILFAKPYPTRTAAAALCATVTAYGTACQIKTARHHPANSP